MTAIEIPVRGSDRPALVDAADEALVMPLPWRAHSHGYVCFNRSVNGKSVTVLMHRLIADPAPGMQVDHANRDKFDNRRANLREATRSQNQGNIGLRIDNTSGFRGVYLSRSRWVARIHVQGRAIHVGQFVDPIDAALAYDRAALEHFGEFATLNFPERALERAA